MPRLLLVLLATAAAAACQSAAVPDGPLPESSVYTVDTRWQTDAGDSLVLTDLRGTPVALAMIYADCGTACPMIVHDMKEIGEAAGTPLRYVLVSLDPARDTPEHMAAFRKAHGLGGDWTMLRGTPDDVQTLAAVLGVRYRFDADGAISHSNLITLLGPDGAVAARQEGIGTDPTPAVAALTSIL